MCAPRGASRPSFSFATGVSSTIGVLLPLTTSSGSIYTITLSVFSGHVTEHVQDRFTCFYRFAKSCFALSGKSRLPSTSANEARILVTTTTSFGSFGVGSWSSFSRLGAKFSPEGLSVKWNPGLSAGSLVE